MATISSKHNPRIKQAFRLRDRRGRQQQGRIIIDGMREVERALAGNGQAIELFICREMVPEPRLEELAHHLEQAGCESTYVTEPVFRHLAFGDRSEGVILIAEYPSLNLDDINVHQNSLIAVLEDIEKPGNLGAVVRTADAAGVTAVIAAGGGTDFFNPNTIRASMGAVFHIPLAAASTDAVLTWLRGQKIDIYAARVDASLHYAAADYRRAAVIVLGSEAMGLSPKWNRPEMTAIRLPMLGLVDSLNVSATAAVLFYEALRQRQEVSPSQTGQ